MPQLYSYLRWSSGRQEKGTTRTRQAAAARAYAAEHKLEMIEIIEPGLSAFRGKNRKGKLGDFIDAVKSGTIPSDSYLVKALITRFRDGLPGNMKSVGKHPWWIDESGSQYDAVKKHEQYWPIAREIIELFMAGNGAYKVRRYLDNKYPKGFVGGAEWDYHMLMRMRKSRALIGERTIVLNKK